MGYEVRKRLLEADRSRLTYGIVAAVVLVLAPFVLGAFQTGLLTKILLLGVFATAFNLLYGYTGLLSFGHAMFVATAAYTSAKVFKLLGPALGFGDLFGGASVLVTFAAGVVLGTLLATLLAVVVGYLSVQLEEIYFAMITLSFSMAIWAIFQKDISGQVGGAIGYSDLLSTNGSDGLTIAFSALGEVNLFGLTFELVDINSYVTYYFIVLLMSVVTMYALWRIVQSPFGTVCKAVRENPGRAQALGIDTTYHAWMTFIISGAFSGLVGTLWAPLQGNALPTYAHWTFSAHPVIMTVIGGPYSFVGPLVGALVYEYLRYGISQVPVLEAHWQFVFGVILLSVVLYFDNGIAGGIEKVVASVNGTPESTGASVDDPSGGGVEEGEEQTGD